MNNVESSSSEFGRLLRDHRRAAGLSQESLALLAGMSVNGISALERGDRRKPQRQTLALLSGALGLDELECETFASAAGRSGSRSLSAVPDLPCALSSFVGREAAVGAIAALVREHRLITLTGPGGIGKTRTALQVATSCAGAVGAVCFIELAPVGNPSLVVSRVAEALAVTETLDHSLLEAVLGSLKNERVLLILDNCEHVIAEVARVSDALLLNCPHVRILATSRESLRTAGEHRYRLPPLETPTTEETPSLTAVQAGAYAAIGLFIDRAGAIDHHFTLTDENAPVLGQICRRLDGIPLAIELAAERVSLLSIKGLAEKLHDRFSLLRGGGRAAPARQRTMRANIDWSYRLLSPPEQQLFASLAVFAGGCTHAAAASAYRQGDAGEGDVLELLSSLVDKSLVVTDEDAGELRFSLLESFRSYARERLEARRDDSPVRYAV